MDNFWKCLRKCCSPFPQRYVVSYVVLTGLTIQYIHRTAFTLAITEIAHKLHVTKEEKLNVCPYNETEEANVHATYRSKEEFYWSAKEQIFLGSIFYVGYVISHVPGGVLSDMFGPKRVLGYGCLLSAICSVIIPYCARTHFYLLALVRTLEGIGQGAMFPAQCVFVARWALPEERNCLNSIMSVGINLGGMIGTVFTGFMLKYLDKWEYTFYVLAIVTLIWYVFWVIFAHNTAEHHPFISEKEKEMLEIRLKSEVDIDLIPSYIPALKSIPLWAAIIASAGNDWVFFIIMTLLPQYTAYVLHYDIEANGYVNALPFVSAIFFTVISPYIADCLIKSGMMKKTMQHKVFLFITNEGPCLCMILASYAGCSSTPVVILFALAMGLTGVIYSSVRVTNVDMAPNLAGFTMALMNGFGAITGFVGPEVFALVITSHTVSDWRVAILISCAIVTLSTLIYLILGTSEIQPWNFPTGDNTDRRESSESVNNTKIE